MKIMNLLSFIVLSGLVAIPALQGAEASPSELARYADIQRAVAHVSAGPGLNIQEADLKKALSLLQQDVSNISNPTPSDANAVVTVDNAIEFVKDTAVEAAHDAMTFAGNTVDRLKRIVTHGPTLRDAYDATRFTVSVAPATTLGYLLWPAKDCVGWVRRPRQFMAIAAAFYLLNYKSDIAKVFQQLRALDKRVSLEGSETRRQMVKNFNILAIIMQINATNLYKQIEANHRELVAAGEQVNNNVLGLRGEVGNNHSVALAAIENSAQKLRRDVGTDIAADGDRTRMLIEGQTNTQTALRDDVADVRVTLNGQLARLEQMQRNLATMMQFIALAERGKVSSHAAAGAGA